MGIEIREFRTEDAENILPRLRRADVEEARALGRDDLRAALADAVDSSDKVWSAVLGDDVLAVFGAGPLSYLGGVGFPWFIAAEGLSRHRRAFTTNARVYIGKMLEMYPVLTNCVHDKNVVAIAWLKRAGFRILEDDAFVVPATGERFYWFHMERH